MVSPKSEEASSVDRRTRLLASAAITVGRLSEVLTPLGELFAQHGHELYLVGGTVRDAVLGRLGTDLDFTTDARPEAVQELMRGWADHLWDTGGLAFGTVSAAKDGQQLEITTFRADNYDRVSRNPEVTFGDTLEADLVRRDFRVNAMAVRIGELGELEFVDPLNGMADLLEGVLDTPALPQDSFQDDPLRMLRGARFVSQLGFRLAPRVRDAIAEMAPEIDRITAERVHTELDKLIAGDHPTEGIDIMVETGLAERVLPELPAMKLEIDEHHQHKDVYEHSLTVLRQAIDQEEGDPDLVLRWAALLHDIGKPPTKKNEPGGGVSFHHHEVVGAKMVRKRMRALKYPKQFTEDVARLVYLHLRFHGYGKGQWTDSAVRRYVTDGAELLPACTNSSAPTAPPATSAAPPNCAPPTTTWKPASSSSRSRRTSTASAPTSTATPSWNCSASSPAPTSARPGNSSRNSASTAAPSPARRRRQPWSSGGNPGPERRRTPVIPRQDDECGQKMISVVPVTMAERICARSNDPANPGRSAAKQTCSPTRCVLMIRARLGRSDSGIGFSIVIRRGARIPRQCALRTAMVSTLSVISASTSARTRLRRCRARTSPSAAGDSSQSRCQVLSHSSSAASEITPVTSSCCARTLVGTPGTSRTPCAMTVSSSTRC